MAANKPKSGVPGEILKRLAAETGLELQAPVLLCCSVDIDRVWLWVRAILGFLLGEHPITFPP